MNEKRLASKKETVQEITNYFRDSASAIVVEYRGISVKDMTDLRRQLREEGVDIKIYKNTLVKRATEEVGYQELDEALVGPNAIAFSKDAVAPSRVLSRFARRNRRLVIKQGIVEGRMVDLDAIKELASLPNKDGMIAMLLGALQSPIRQFAYAVSQIEPSTTATQAEETAAEASTQATPAVEKTAQEAVSEAAPEKPEAAPEVAQEEAPESAE